MKSWIKFVRLKYPWIRIDNHLAFFGAIFGFFGTLIATVDRFPATHQYISSCSKWRNIDEAIFNLPNIEHPDREHLIPTLRIGKPGFDDLLYIIKLNRPDLSAENITAIYTQGTVGFGQDDNLKIRILCVGLRKWSIIDGYKSVGKPIAFEVQFIDWVNAYRQRYFLTIGLSVATIGFLLGIFSRLRLVRDTNLLSSEVITEEKADGNQTQ